MADDMITLYVAILVQTAVASFIWKDNKLYRFACIAAIAGGSANGFVAGVIRIYENAILGVSADVTTIVPIIMGLMLLTIHFREYRWIQRYPQLFSVALGVGLMLTGTIKAQILNQIAGTIEPLASTSTLLNGLLVLIGVVCTMIFFTYTRRHTGITGTMARIGRLFLMASLGPYWAGELNYHMNFGVRYVQMLLQALGIGSS